MLRKWDQSIGGDDAFSYWFLEDETLGGENEKRQDQQAWRRTRARWAVSTEERKGAIAELATMAAMLRGGPVIAVGEGASSSSVQNIFSRRRLLRG